MIMSEPGPFAHHGGMHKLVLVLTFAAATQASAQHVHPQPSSPYRGEQAREIKALSADEQSAWLEGRGAGLAKAAELNGHPGPMHVLEHAGELGLSASQQQETRALLERHKAEVRRLGAELVEAERRLDELFKTRHATPAAVTELTQAIGQLQARIRASHLVTHIEQTRLLRADQVAAYDRLRGYAR